ncbi:uncharacterized protein LOC126819204 [Patella vulgata]|uniref:uncharacterized protein LOC126819204 n=1 Tax=Patella vulgata TaxID=6465 RepID=UPI00217F9B7D|nr:uncharacterized protein LOC126819204 [Patella vulgata]
MEGSPKRFQTVFLIDIAAFRNYDSNDNSSKLLHLHKSVALSSFRILHYFHSESRYYNCDEYGRQTDCVKWSFKLFDSSVYKVGRKLSNFREFKLRYFEEFEKELENCVSKLLKSNSPPKCREANRKTRNPCAADNLSKALNEVLYDFQWEIPEFLSPLKGQKQRQMSKLSAQSNNFVFLYSCMPRNNLDLRLFCGKKVIDEDVFMDSFMSQSLYKMFHLTSKLSLYWIDTHLKPQSSVSAETKASEIIDNSLRKIGGSAFSLRLILNLPLVDPSSSEKETFGFSFEKFVKKLSTASVFNIKFGIPNIDTSNNSYEGCISLLEGDKCISVPVLLTNTSYDLNTQSPCTSNSVGEIEDNNILITLCSDINNIKSHNIKEKISISMVGDKNIDDNMDVKPGFYKVIGSVEKKDHDLHNIHICKTFICNSVKGDDKSVLQTLLQDMLKQHKILILFTASIVPYVATLEPINTASGVLTLYKIGSSLQIEKAIFQQEESRREINCHGNNKATKEDIKLGKNLSKSKIEALGHQYNKQSYQIQKHATGITKHKKRVFNSQMLDKCHLPGTSPAIESLIVKLNQRLHDLEFLNATEKKTLKNLQKFYRKQSRPPKISDLKPMGELNIIDENAISAEDVKMSSTVVEGGYPLKRQSSTLSRTDIIINRSKNVQKRQSTEIVGSSQKVKDEFRNNLDFSNINLENDEDVSKYIKDVYENCLEKGDQLESSVHTIVTVVLHYMKSNNHQQPEESAKILIGRSVMLNNSKLREKYLGKISEQENKEKLTEYQLQILLILELESVTMTDDIDHLDQCADEIVNMLRSISFISDQSIVPKFLNEVLVKSYSSTVPKVLVTIFDELMQPLPIELEGFGSPNSSGTAILDNSGNSHNDNSLFEAPTSNTSNHSDKLLTQPTRRSRRVVQYPSMSDLGNKKQIMVKLDIKAATNKVKKPRASSRTSQKPTKHKQKENEAVNVRRNLFDGERTKLDRRQSVAIMETVRRSPRKKVVSSMAFKSPGGKKSPSNIMVAETPSHKQRANPTWRQQEKQRRRTHSKDGIQIINESPMKTAEVIPETDVKPSPGRFRKKPAVTRRSFYSASSTRSRPRNLSAYYNLGDRIAGRHRAFSSTEENINKSLSQLAQSTVSNKFMSPTRRSRSFLMSQLMSPSPHKSPSQKDFRSQSSRKTSKTPKKTPKKTPSRILFESPRTKSVRKSSFQSPAAKKDSAIDACFVSETPEKFTPLNSDFEAILRKTPKRFSPTTKIKNSTKKYAENLNKTPTKVTNNKVSSSANHETPQKNKTPKFNKERSPKIKFTPGKSAIATDNINNPNRTPEANNVKKFEEVVKKSPFQNTRSQVPITPTRSSVCTALFTKSPPRSQSATKTKQTDDNVFKTPRKTLKLKSPPTSVSKKMFFSPLKDCESVSNLKVKDCDSVSNLKVKNCDSVNNLRVKDNNLKIKGKGGDITPKKPTYIIRTPSPKDAMPSTRTPDFDTWPRRKRRRESSGNKLNNNNDEVTSKTTMKDQTINTNITFKNNKKRDMIIYKDEASIASPHKRRRTHLQDNSTPSSDNDFLSQCGSETKSTEDSENRTPHSPVLGAYSPLRISKLTSEHLRPPNSDRDRAVSFSTRNISPVLQGKSLSSPQPPTSKTQLLMDSPMNKKFSPSISSNSLVQLMNSPLIHSEKKKTINVLKSPSGKSPHSKSRKSLQLGD